MRRVVRSLAVVTLVWAVAVAVTTQVSGTGEETPPTPDLVVRGGVEAIFVEQSPDLDPVHIEVRDGAATLTEGDTDEFGGLVLDRVPDTGTPDPDDTKPLPAGTYEVVAADLTTPTDERSLGPVRVLGTESDPSTGEGPWPYGAQDLLAQSEQVDNPYPTGVFDGVDDDQFRYGYLTTRDGTRLSFFLALPASCAITDPATATTTTTTGSSSTTTPNHGPATAGCSKGTDTAVPTIIDYSGYDPSAPKPMISRDADRFLAEGYAVMGVNARGTGCSGGAIRGHTSNLAEALDGYDVIETIAAQDWSQGRVGMTGHSGPGVSQLNVARTKPPSLKAITPGAAYARLVEPAWPGGIENVWGSQVWGGVVMNMNLPASLDADGRQERAEADGARFDLLPPEALAFVRDEGEDHFAHYRVTVDHDAVCAANQRLRGQNTSITELLAGGPGTALDDVDLEAHAGDIETATLIVVAAQDQSSGTSVARLAAQLPANATVASTDGPYHRLVVGNGDHDLITRVEVIKDEVGAFLRTFVAEQRPDASCAGDAYQDGSGLSGTLAGLWAEGEAVRVVGEIGTDTTLYGECQHRWETGLPGWPPAGEAGFDPVTLETYQGGLLLLDEDNPSQPGRVVADPAPSYDNVPVPLDFEDTIGPTDSGNPPQYIRPQRPAPSGESATYDTMPLGAPRLFVGPADLHLEADVTPPASCSGETTEPIDFEVSLWEVTAEHQQVFIQSGWKRAATPCSGRVETDVSIADISHLVRADSGLRLTISAPGYTTPSWRLDVEDREATIEIDTTATDLHLNVATALPSSFPADPPVKDDLTNFPPDPGDPPRTSLLGQHWSTTIGPVSDLDVEQTDTDEVEVSWAAPSVVPSGVSISRYVVTNVITGDAQEVTSGPLTATFDGLTEAPFFTVQAFSTSRAGELVLSGVLYGPPTSVTATATGATSIDVSWTAPVASLALPITQYDIVVKQGSTVIDTLHTASTSIGATGLDPDTTYTFTVSANTFFPSNPRSTSAPVTETTDP
jgi:hypothetical protein